MIQITIIDTDILDIPISPIPIPILGDCFIQIPIPTPIHNKKFVQIPIPGIGIGILDHIGYWLNSNHIVHWPVHWKGIITY